MNCFVGLQRCKLHNHNLYHISHPKIKQSSLRQTAPPAQSPWTVSEQPPSGRKQRDELGENRAPPKSAGRPVSGAASAKREEAPVAPTSGVLIMVTSAPRAEKELAEPRAPPFPAERDPPDSCGSSLQDVGPVGCGCALLSGVGGLETGESRVGWVLNCLGQFWQGSRL